MAIASVSNEVNAPAQVGNPLLGQIRDFIDADEPAPIDPLGIIVRTIRGRITDISLVTAIVATLLAVLAWLAISPAYQSTGVVRLLPVEAKLLYNDADDSRLRLYDAFTNAEVHLMQSRTVLEGAWNALHDQVHNAPTAPFAMPKDVGELGQLITITNRKGLVTVAGQSSDRVLAAAAVNAVLDAYEGNKQDARNRINDVKRNELAGRERQLAAQLDELDQRYLAVGAEHDITSLSKAHIAKTAQLEVLEERLGELDNTIAQFQQTGGVGANDIRNAEIQRALLLDQAMADMTYERANRLAELSTLRSRYRPTHSRVKTAELELQTLEAAIAERRDQITTLGNVGALTGGTSQSSEQSLDELNSVRQNLVDRRLVMRNEASELIGKLVSIRRIVAEQERVGTLLEETKRALDEVVVESQAGLSSSIDIIARGKVPNRPIEDKRKPIAFGAAFFGALMTLLGFILATLFNPRIRYSDDLKPELAQKIAVTIPGNDRDNANLARAGLKLRNEIDIRRAGTGNSIVISVSGTTAAANSSGVAVTLGDIFSAGRKSVLIIDANPRSQITTQLSLRSGSGLADLMSGNASITDVAEPVAAEQGTIHVIGSGASRKPESQDRVNRFALQDFRNLAKAARAHYDVIVMDLGELAAGRHSALGASVSDQLIHIVSTGARKRDLESSAALLDRVIADRYLLVLEDADELDPANDRQQDEPSLYDKATQILKNLKRHLEKK